MGLKRQGVTVNLKSKEALKATPTASWYYCYKVTPPLKRAGVMGLFHVGQPTKGSFQSSIALCTTPPERACQKPTWDGGIWKELQPLTALRRSATPFNGSRKACPEPPRPPHTAASPNTSHTAASPRTSKTSYTTASHVSLHEKTMQVNVILSSATHEQVKVHEEPTAKELLQVLVM